MCQSFFFTLCVDRFVAVVPATDWSSFFACACDWALLIAHLSKESSPLVYILGICALLYRSSSIFIPVGRMKVLETYRFLILHHLVVYFVCNLVFDAIMIT